MINSKHKYSLAHRIKSSWVSYLMLIPFFSLVLFFIVIPVSAAIVLSFTDFNMVEFPKWVGWLNYQRLFIEDQTFLIALKNTLFFALVNGPISYIFAFIMAWIINEMPRKFRVFMTVVFYAPSISGNIYFIWTYLFNGDQYGIANSFLMNMNIIKEPIQWLTDAKYNMTIVILIQIWLSLGVGFLSFIAGLQSIDISQYEAGIIDGIKNRFQRLWYITIPNMKSMLLFGAVIQIAGALSVGDVTQALTGGYTSMNYSTMTIINYITDYATQRYEMGYASAIGVVLFILVVVCKKSLFRLFRS
ncbi:MAG: sugar ABC transporter permease [Clostridiales bacterium]|nr:sugar ABC transporter permease [Clostridiales bacterium]